MLRQEFTGRWVGDLRGSLVGNLFAEFVPGDGGGLSINVSIGFNNERTARVSGPLKEDGARAVAIVRAIGPDGNPVVPPTTGNLRFETIAADHLAGSWELDDGAKGVFSLARSHIDRKPDAESAGPHEPLQVTQRTRQLARMTIYRDELQDIIATMKTLLPAAHDVIVRCEIDGVDVRRFAPPSPVRYL